MSLLEQISYKKAYRENRLNAAEWVLDHEDTLPELVAYCFHEDKELATKASWVLEFVARKKLVALLPHLDYFFEHLATATTDGQLRSFALICELLCLDYYKKQHKPVRLALLSKHKEQMTECCFDWMITSQKVACQARAMTCIYFLGTEQDWIHPELHRIISDHLHLGSAGYQSRGKKILELINNFKASH